MIPLSNQEYENFDSFEKFLANTSKKIDDFVNNDKEYEEEKESIKNQFTEIFKEFKELNKKLNTINNPDNLLLIQKNVSSLQANIYIFNNYLMNKTKNNIKNQEEIKELNKRLSQTFDKTSIMIAWLFTDLNNSIMSSNIKVLSEKPSFEKVLLNALGAYTLEEKRDLGLDTLIHQKNNLKIKLEIFNIIENEKDKTTILEHEGNELKVPTQFYTDIFRSKNLFFNTNKIFEVTDQKTKENCENELKNFVQDLNTQVGEKASLKMLACLNQAVTAYPLETLIINNLTTNEEEGGFGFSEKLLHVASQGGGIQYNIIINNFDEVKLSIKLPIKISSLDLEKDNGIITGFIPLKIEILTPLDNLQGDVIDFNNFNVEYRIGKLVPVKKGNYILNEEEQENIALQNALKILNVW